jgi:cell division protein FtsI/penicillin-binding protein 2
MSSRFRKGSALRFVIASGFLIWVASIAGCLWQGVEEDRDAEHLFREASKGQSHGLTAGSSGYRGSILDRTGVVLATTTETVSVCASLSAVPELERWVPEVSAILGIDLSRVLKKVTDTKDFVWLKTGLSEEEVLRIKALRLQGIEFVGGFKRMYPCGGLAAAVLGFVDSGGRGLEGVEYSCDGRLRRKDISENAMTGRDIALTLERGLQITTEAELERQISQLKASKGCLVLMDVESGEILALASSPSWEPARFWEYDPHTLKNLALRDEVDPVILLPLVNWLAQEKASPDTPGQESEAQGDIAEEVGSGNKSESTAVKNREWRWESPADGLAVWTPWTGEELTGLSPHENLLKGLWFLGLGQRTGIDLPAEKPGRLPRSLAGIWNPVAHQGLRATPIQMLRVFSALINGGKITNPHVVMGDETDSFPGLGKSVDREGTETSLSEDDLAAMFREKLAVRKGPSLAGLKWDGSAEGPSTRTPAQVTALGFWPPDSPKVSYIIVLDGVTRDPRRYKGRIGGVLDVAKQGAGLPMEKNGSAEAVSENVFERQPAKANKARCFKIS